MERSTPLASSTQRVQQKIIANCTSPKSQKRLPPIATTTGNEKKKTTGNKCTKKDQLNERNEKEIAARSYDDGQQNHLPTTKRTNDQSKQPKFLAVHPQTSWQTIAVDIFSRATDI